MPEPRDLIQSLYDAFGRGDAGYVLGLLHDSVEWNEAQGNPLADRNPYSSPQEVGEGVFGRILAAFDDFTATPRELLADGGTVVALGRYGGTHKESGAVLSAPFAHVWRVEDGKVTRFQQYTDTHQFQKLMGSD